MNNQECKIRSEIINVNANEPMFYPYSIRIKYCIKRKYCIVSRANETRHTKWHKTCKCKRLDASICNNEQRWNEGECRCECIEWIDKGILVIVSVNMINYVVLENI